MSDELYEPADAYPVFILSTIAICTVVLLVEFWENGKGVDALAPPTEDCYYRTFLWNQTLCAASLEQNPLLGPRNEVLVRMGAKEGDLIVTKQQVWRLVAPLYLHGGIFHWLPNMIVMLQLGWRLEMMHGFLKIGIIYMLSGIFGIVMSTVLSPHSLSVGASGAIMGLLGAGVGEVLHNWSMFQRPGLNLCNLVVVAALQLVMGTMPTVDNFAHFFGFLMGAVSSMWLLLVTQVTSSGRPLSAKCHSRMLQTVAFALTYLVFVAGILALYGQWDTRKVCPWCSKIGCMPFPWGCDPMKKGDCFWDCSTCSTSGLSGEASWTNDQRDGTVALRCPLLGARQGMDGFLFENVTVQHQDVRDLAASQLVELCKGHCPDAFA